MGITGRHDSPDDPAIQRFRDAVYGHYERCGRDFPWRHTTDPYHILVAEVMLQQTQTRRVAERYAEFIARFPDFESLSHAPVSDVLAAWQGLGYNRRARALHDAARAVCRVHGGQLPQEREALLALPGVGPYTAAAIRAFAFGLPDAFIETNIRTAFIHDFFPDTDSVRDADILPLVEATVDHADPRRWYQALMDYGSMLKESDNPSRRSAHHRPQSRFEGSRRQARGIILRTLLQDGPTRPAVLRERVMGWDSRFDDALEALKHDSLVVEQDGTVRVTP